jgi:hypothetical protein
LEFLFLVYKFLVCYFLEFLFLVCYFLEFLLLVKNKFSEY